MNKFNVVEMGNEVIEGGQGGYTRLFIYKIPKKNHNAIVRLNKQFINTLGTDGALNTEFFCMSNESLRPLLV